MLHSCRSFEKNFLRCRSFGCLRPIYLLLRSLLTKLPFFRKFLSFLFVNFEPSIEKNKNSSPGRAQGMVATDRRSAARHTGGKGLPSEFEYLFKFSFSFACVVLVAFDYLAFILTKYPNNHKGVRCSAMRCPLTTVRPRVAVRFLPFSLIRRAISD